MKILALSLMLICQPPSPLIARLSAQDQPKVKEPEEVNQFFFLDSTGEIRPLERQKQKGLELAGNHSPIRFVQGEPLAFVVRPSSPKTVDPATILQLIQFKLHGKNRMLEEVVGRSKKELKLINLVPFEGMKYGENSFKIKPKTDLAPGEYGLGINNEKEGYCFGIDPVKADLK